MTKQITDMTGPELVAEHNRLAALVEGVATVNRFATREAGIKRVTDLAERVNAEKMTKVATAASRNPPPAAPEPKPVAERLQEHVEANKAKAPTTPATSSLQGLPVASADPEKDAEMPQLRRNLKPLDLKPKAKVYPRKAGSKQAKLVDLLARPEGATFAELFDAMRYGKPWKGVTVRSSLPWDLNHVAGYGITSEAFNGEQFAKAGRFYEAKRLGMVHDDRIKGPFQWTPGPYYNPDVKLLVYRLAYPEGMTGPLPHTPRAEPKATKKQQG